MEVSSLLRDHYSYSDKTNRLNGHYKYLYKTATNSQFKKEKLQSDRGKLSSTDRPSKSLRQ